MKVLKNENLIKARKELGLTQSDLAKKAGCKKTAVSNWENGYATPPMERAFKVAEILGKDVSYLFKQYKDK